MIQIDEKKEEETKAYFNDLTQKAISNQVKQINDENMVDEEHSSVMNPLETILTLNVKESLMKFQEYQHQLFEDRNSAIESVKKKFSGDNDNPEERDLKVQSLMKKFNEGQNILME